MGKIVSVNISTAKGTGKKPVDYVEVRPEHGIEGDAHAGSWHRQISLLAVESIRKMEDKGGVVLQPGAFAENITTEGLNLPTLPIGTTLICDGVELEITQIGKKCHAKCDIHRQVGECIMPKEGIFAKVLTRGTIRKDADITIKD